MDKMEKIGTERVCVKWKTIKKQPLMKKYEKMERKPAPTKPEAPRRYIPEDRFRGEPVKLPGGGTAKRKPTPIAPIGEPRSPRPTPPGTAEKAKRQKARTKPTKAAAKIAKYKTAKKKKTKKATFKGLLRERIRRA